MVCMVWMVPRILIEDDEGDFIELVKFRLTDLGYEFLVATDGVQALSSWLGVPASAGGTSDAGAAVNHWESTLGQTG